MARVVEAVTSEGFGAFGPAQTLRLGGQGCVAVVGENGAGKSTAASKALMWALWGKGAPERMGSGTKTVKGKGVVADGYKTATVSVVVRDEITDEVWTIERTRTRTKADRVTVRSSVSGEVSEDRIADIVGARYEVFCKTVVRGQGDIWNFAEAAESKKQEILDEVSGAIILTDDYKAARKLRGEARADRDQCRDRLEALKRRSDEHEGQARALYRQRDEWEAARAARVAEKRDTVTAMEAAEVTAKVADESMAALAKQRATLEAAAPTVDFAPYSAAIQHATGNLTQAQGKASAAALAWQQVEHLAVGHTCPTCAQVIAPDAPVAEARAEREPVYHATQAALYEAQTAATNARTQQTGAQQWLRDEQAAHRVKLNALGPVQRQARHPIAQQATANARQAVEAAVQGDNPYTVAVNEAIATSARLRRDMAVHAELLAHAERDVVMASEWLTTLSPTGARAHLSESALVGIEVEANRWLGALTEGTMQIEFPLGDNGKVETRIGVMSKQNRVWVERDLLFFSGGERSRINMAVDLGVAAAFGQGDNPLSLLVLDENVFSGLDAQGQQAIVYALQQLGIRDVVVIDHNAQLSAVIPRSVLVETDPTDGCARLTESSHGE